MQDMGWATRVDQYPFDSVQYPLGDLQFLDRELKRHHVAFEHLHSLPRRT